MYYVVVIFMGMEEIRELIEKNFTLRVDEDVSGIKVIFTSTMGEGVIWFERAKKGWSTKPISTNQYIIVNAELSHVLTFLNRYYQLDESNYHEIRRMFIDMGMDKVDEYTKGEPKGV
jgi:hypothetical protein|tara:strand:- start:2902 stop:3252 length:351 start_codon:yes stop_codon:yes gene_type:complete